MAGTFYSILVCDWIWDGLTLPIVVKISHNSSHYYLHVYTCIKNMAITSMMTKHRMVINTANKPRLEESCEWSLILNGTESQYASTEVIYIPTKHGDRGRQDMGGGELLHSYRKIPHRRYSTQARETLNLTHHLSILMFDKYLPHTKFLS